QPRITVATKIVVNHHEAGFPQEQIKSEILDALRWITPRVDWEITISHNGSIPDIRDFDFACSSWITVHFCVHRGIETGMFQLENCFLGKYSLRENHYTVVRQPCPLLVQRHTPECFRDDCTDSLAIRNVELTSSVVAPMYAN